MTVYLDVLIFLNAIVNFFLICLTEKMLKLEISVFRSVVSALSGALFSMYILLPTLNFWLELLMRLSSSCVIIAILVGIKKRYLYLRALLYFYLVSFLFAGIMIAVYYIFKPQNLAINNGIVYYDFSSLFLIFVTVVSYFVISFIRKIFMVDIQTNDVCKFQVYLNDIMIEKFGLIDSGFKAVDVFSNSELIVFDDVSFEELTDKQTVKQIAYLQEPTDELLNNRFRMTSLKTISGETLVGGIRCDMMKIYYNNSIFKLYQPIIVLSKTKFSNAYSAIIPISAVNSNYKEKVSL